MKRIFLLIALSVLTFAVTAQNKANSLGANDPKAKKILDDVSAEFKKHATIFAKFQLTIESANDKVIGIKNGEVFMKGKKYRVTIHGGEDIIFDGAKIWTYDHELNEVTVSKYDPQSSSITPQKLFTNFYDKDFLYRLIKTGEKVDGKLMSVIELTPVDKTQAFFKVLLYIHNNTIQRTKIFEKSGNRYTYKLNDLNTKRAMNDDIFIFKVKNYPGVEVIDLR